ncbi:DMT family transporter [Streptomyces sp. HSW2009]|uniref:DMT family transporter n=1 Tax=Streptomyces sp. HSW2009 TaxID=3142890 RepID=UPI0032EFB5B4
MSRPLLGTLLASGAAIALGSLFPVAAGIFRHVDALHTTTLRYLLAAVLLLAVLAGVEGRRALRFDGRAAQVIGLGVIGIAGVNLLSFVGLANSTPQNTALIVALQPCIAVVVMWLRTRRAPGPAKLGVTLLALVGVALVITKGSIGGAVAGGVGIGEGLVLIAALLWVLYSIGAASLTGWSPLRYTALTSAVGAVVMAAVTEVVTLAGGARTPTTGDLAAVAVPLLYIVLVCGVGAILAWNASMKILGPGNAVLFSTLIPITALTIQIVRGYRPGAVEIAGAVIAVTALVASSLLDRRTARRAATTALAAPPAGAARPEHPEHLERSGRAHEDATA